MRIRDYEKFVADSAKMGIKDLAYSVIGLAGETGEVAEWYKKVVMRKSTVTNLTEEDLKQELGDVIHYVTRIGLYYGWGLKQIIQANVEKLEKRQNAETDHTEYVIVPASDRTVWSKSQPREYDTKASHLDPNGTE